MAESIIILFSKWKIFFADQYEFSPTWRSAKILAQYKKQQLESI